MRSGREVESHLGNVSKMLLDQIQRQSHSIRVGPGQITGRHGLCSLRSGRKHCKRIEQAQQQQRGGREEWGGEADAEQPRPYPFTFPRLPCRVLLSPRFPAFAFPEKRGKTGRNFDCENPLNASEIGYSQLRIRYFDFPFAIGSSHSLCLPLPPCWTGMSIPPSLQS